MPFNPQALVRADQVPDRWGLNLLLYGQSGVGKTTLAATAQDSPHGADVLFVDLEGGTRSIAHRADIHLFRPDRWEDLTELYAWLNKETHTYRTVVVDSLSEAFRMCMDLVLRDSKTPDQSNLQDYSRATERTIKMVRAYRSLATRRGMNVIFTTLETEVTDEQTRLTLVQPALTPQVSKGVRAAVDGVVRLVMDKEGKRALVLQSTSPGVIAKFRHPTTNPLPARLEAPTMSRLLDLVRQTTSAPPAPQKEVA
jgi:phage nucleotide-binding protein